MNQLFRLDLLFKETQPFQLLIWAIIWASKMAMPSVATSWAYATSPFLLVPVYPSLFFSVIPVLPAPQGNSFQVS